MPPKSTSFTCYNCGQSNHISRNCPRPKKVKNASTTQASMCPASSSAQAASSSNTHNHITQMRSASNPSPLKQSLSHLPSHRFDADWKSRTVKPRGAKKFPHVNSNGTEWDGWASYYRSLQEEGKKNQAQRWIGEIPFDTKFAYMYIVTCPPPNEVNPYKPEGLEFLTPILKEAQQKYKCFIWYLPNIYEDKPGFGIVGNSRTAMDEAAVICEGISRWLFADAHLKEATKTFWLVKPVPPRELRSRIIAVDQVGVRVNESYTSKCCYQFDGDHLDKASLLKAVGDPIFSLADLEPGVVPIGSASANHINALYLEAFLMKALDPLRYSREHFRLVIRLGTCLSQIDKDVVTDGISLEIFKDRLAEDMNSQEHNFKSEFTSMYAPSFKDWLSALKLTDDRIVEERHALDLQLRFSENNGFNARNEGKPSRSIELSMVSGYNPGDRASVDITFKIGNTGAIEKVKKWYTIEAPKKDHPEKLLQINMLDLQQTNLSYSIALEHVQRKPLQSPSRAQMAFVNAIFIDALDGSLKTPSREFALPAKVLQMVDKRTWTYETGHGYLLDLTKSQVYDFVDGIVQVQDTCWMVSVRHESWTATFAANTRLLKPGKYVDWLADEAHFFPVQREGAGNNPFQQRIEKTLPRPRGEGCKGLLEVLKSIGEVVLDTMKVPKPSELL